jgi:uncharacterized protein (TIGR01777 family)
MHILLTGGTGLIGSHLCRHWLSQGHRITVWSRTPEQVPQRCGTQVRGVKTLEALKGETFDAVVNLAGAPIAQRPWTRRRRELLWNSRIGLTEQLLVWLEAQPQRPRVLLSGSAVGWYGDGGERQLDERAEPVQEDFASRLCIAWEETAMRAEAMGVRVVLLRTGLVLSTEGGMLTQLLRPYRLGLGGPIGHGRQWMPWIHMADQIGAIDFLLNCGTASGPYNACAPSPVRNREFAQQLGRALHRPAILPLPGFLLRAGLGEMSGLLLGGQRAVPARLEEAGYTFAFSDLQSALDDLLRHA